MMKFFKKAKWFIAPFILIVSIVSSRFISFPIVYGQSMENNFHDGDILLLNKMVYKSIEDIERFDVVVVRGSDGFLIIKRVIALPGETIQIIDGKTYINDIPLEDKYGKERIELPGIAKDPYLIPDDCIFVMGDNRNNSSDSREIGAVSYKNVLGKCTKYLANIRRAQ